MTPCCRYLDEFAVENGVVVICDEVESVDALRGEVKLASGGVLHFSRWRTFLLLYI